MRDSRIRCVFFNIRNRRDHLLGARTPWLIAAVLVAAVLVFAVSPAQSKGKGKGKGPDEAQSKVSDELICLSEGPVPGCIAEELPEELVNEEVRHIVDDLSDGATNTPEPEHANQMACESHEVGETCEVTGVNLNLTILQGNGKVDIPTGAAPSPLSGAQPFTQQMLRFEEFGPVPLGSENEVMAIGQKAPFPAPVWPDVFPDETKLDTFLKQYRTPTKALPWPYPTKYANDPDNCEYSSCESNPWQDEIEAYLGRSLHNPPAEGRAAGLDWSHQRWEEFYPEVYYTTAQAGARINTGLRDDLQFHRFEVGEFGPGPDMVSGTDDDGLYHTAYRADGQSDVGVGTNAGINVQFHPNLEVQDPLALWTWDGTFPPKLLMARYGEPIMMRHYNALPISPADNMGFGLHTISTHEHNGHTPAESDGYTQAFFFPGQFYDYRWPMVIAGHDSLNELASDPRAGTPFKGDPGGTLWNGTPAGAGITNVPGDWRETMSTHWFHDHMLDFTATNVYKGNAAMMNYYSSLDRGNEAIDDGVNVRLPSGRALDWGNRDYDINLLLKGIAWDDTGQLWFNIFNTDGMLGDRMMTNWLYHPYLKVRARRYRFRILNASVSRYIRLAVVEQVNGSGGELAGLPGSETSYNRVPFYMVANDGNIMEHTVYFDGNKTVGGLTNRKGILPSQGIAERYDIVIDFAQFAPGTKLYMVNLLEHRNGRRPHVEIPLGDILDGSYAPRVKNGRHRTDTTVAKFLEFRVQACTKPDGTPAASCVDGGEAVVEQQDASMNPADFVEGGDTMIPLPGFTKEELENAVHRTFEFKRSSGTDSAPWTIKTDGGAGFNMDPRRLSAAPNHGPDGKGVVEIWHLKGNGGWSHPIHVHFEEGQIFKRGGKEPPEWERWARKDVYRVGRLEDSTSSVDFAIRFREFLGSYMEHCHNTQHEDHAMLLRWDIEKPGQVRVMPTPMPSWDGVGYVPSYALPTFRSGDLGAAEDAADDPDFGHLQ
jgi:FtsP/CotA-like multicopper oxidase with cupredoxin domain